MSFTFSQTYLDKLTATGVTLTINGTVATLNAVINIGDLLVAVPPAGKQFATTATPTTSSIYIKQMDKYGKPEYFPFDISNPLRATLTYSEMKGVSNKQFFVDVVDYVAPVLTWGTAPNNTQLGTDVNFTWSGGVAPYSVVVVAPDGSTVHDNVTGLSTGNYSLHTETGNSIGAYSITVTDSASPAATLTASIDVTEAPVVAYYNIKQIDLDNAANAHAVLTVRNTPAVLGTPVAIGDVITATADAGYEFAMITNPDIPSAQIASVYFVENSRYGNKNTSFTLSADKKTCTFTMVENTGEFVYNQIKLSSVQLTPDVTGTNNIYKIDKDILAAVNRKRFKIVSDGGTTPNETVYDYGQFILSVLSLPFAIPEQYVLNDENIILANLDTGVKAPALSSDLIKINMGSITVNPVNNNLLDYINTVAIMRLPRVDSIAIDLEYVIGKTLNIEYLLDCYTGRATVNIVSSETGETVVSKQVDIGVSVPYINIHNDAQLSNDNVEVSGDNGIYTPFIELVKIDTLLSDGMFTIPIIDENELTNQTGFIRVEEINLNSSATRNEKNELISILRNGVIIK